MPRAPHRTAEDWAELLGTRVLSPDEFDGIANGPHTIGWSVLQATQLPANLAELEVVVE